MRTWKQGSHCVEGWRHRRGAHFNSSKEGKAYCLVCATGMSHSRLQETRPDTLRSLVLDIEQFCFRCFELLRATIVVNNGLATDRYYTAVDNLLQLTEPQKQVHRSRKLLCRISRHCYNTISLLRKCGLVYTMSNQKCHLFQCSNTYV